MIVQVASSASIGMHEDTCEVVIGELLARVDAVEILYIVRVALVIG